MSCESLWIKGLRSYEQSNLEDWKKFCHSTGVEPHAGSKGLSPGWWDCPKGLMDRNFVALWSSETHSASLERSKALLKNSSIS